MELESEVLQLSTRHPFHIARAVGPMVRRNVWVRLRHGDVEGWGEAAVNPYYGETDATAQAVLPRYGAVLAAEGVDPDHLEALEHAVLRAVGRNAAARAGISAALHDLAGKRLGVPVWRLLGLEPRAARSSFTIGLDRTEVMLERLEEARGYPILKVKVGTERDGEVLTALRRAAPDVMIRVDANTAWTGKQALARLPLLEEVGVELIEQPFAADDLDAFRLLRDRTSIPVVADESCMVAADVPRLRGLVDGVNIKLAKCGSMREALRIVHVARAHGMGVMLGCMMESTLGIAAAVQLAPLADWLDLDGAALMADDPFAGPGIEADGSVRFNREPGLGVRHGTR
jgi:L-alanine-DL-glutamate epimerase-like enolase superfamily enzyme